MRHQTVFTALLILISVRVTATEVIAMVYPDRILLGVDSRISYTDKTGKGTFLSGRKIFQANNTVFAFAGYAGTYGNYARGLKNFNTQLYIKSILDRGDKPLLQNLRDLEQGYHRS